MFASLLYQDQVRAVVFIQNLRSARTATVLDSEGRSDMSDQAVIQLSAQRPGPG